MLSDISCASANAKAESNRAENIPDHASFHMLSKAFRDISKYDAKCCLRDYYNYSKSNMQINRDFEVV